MAVADAPFVTPAHAQPFEHLLLDFLAYLEFERGLSRNTLEAYRSDLLQLGAYLDRADLDLLEATHADLAGFLDELAAGSDERAAVSPATLQRKVACLRSFYRHLRRESLLDHDPTADLQTVLRLGVEALGQTGPDGTPRTIAADDLEAAVLDRTRPRRAFTRLVGPRLERLLGQETTPA